MSDLAFAFVVGGAAAALVKMLDLSAPHFRAASHDDGEVAALIDPENPQSAINMPGEIINNRLLPRRPEMNPRIEETLDLWDNVDTQNPAFGDKYSSVWRDEEYIAGRQIIDV